MNFPSPLRSCCTFFRLTAIALTTVLQMLFTQGEACSKVVINEFFCMGGGKWPDWIELYNTGDTPQDLSGHFLTDNMKRPKKWSVPEGTVIGPGKYLLFLADKKDIQLHTNFRLNASGEAVAFFSPQGTLLDGLEFPPQKKVQSIGRHPNGQDSWYFFANPTPQAANARPFAPFQTKPIRASSPVETQFSPAGGHYPKALSVSLSVPAEGIMTFTVDGSEPTTDSKRYTNPLHIHSTTVIRARAFKTGQPLGPVVTQTFFIGELSQLPLVSLAIDPVSLWDNRHGIYIKGSRWKENNWDFDLYNYKQNWKREAHFSFFDPNGQNMASLNGRIRIYGATSRKHPQKSLLFELQDWDHSGFQPVADKKLPTFRSVILRNAGDDWGKTLFRDVFMQQLIAGVTDIDYQAHRFVQVFLNGEYWGIYSLREAIDPFYLIQNHGVLPKQVDFLELDGKIIQGDTQHYETLMKALAAKDEQSRAFLDRIRLIMDVGEFTDYQIAQIFFNNLDWPDNNVRYWRPRTDGGKWRWILFDTDNGFMCKGSPPEHNSLKRTLSPKFGRYNVILRKLMENPFYWEFFIQRFSAHLNTTFEQNRVLSLINAFHATLAKDMPRHIQRWESPKSMDQWNREVDILRVFAESRPDHVWEHLRTVFDLKKPVLIDIQNNPGGTILLSGLPLSTPHLIGKVFPGISLTVEAKANPGYRFQEWRGSVASKISRISFVPQEEVRLTAVWTKDKPATK